MLSPKRVKYRKPHKGKNKGFAYRGNDLDFGDYGLQAMTAGRISSRQLEASRVAVNRYIKRGGKFWIRIFPNKSVTVKAAETRMGSGKGNPEFWVCQIKPGRILFELNGVTREQAMEAFRLAGHKLPVQVRFVARETL